ncbi:hypothetical protein ACA351_11405 [Orientia tsutsugamushi]|uniref:hypothetical protein n=1 Tax=Orientia tsutsugamushi TaxID=784 RepID=UPI003527B579
MYSTNFYQAESSSESSINIAQLATTFTFKKEGNNTLILIGWSSIEYSNIIQQVKLNCNREKESVSYRYVASDSSYIAIEYHEYAVQTCNTVYAVENFNYDQLMSVVLKYDHEPLNYQRQKSLDNKDLTIACNDLSENLLEQLDTFTHDDRLAYYSDNIRVHNHDQFRDFVGNILLIDDPER